MLLRRYYRTNLLGKEVIITNYNGAIDNLLQGVSQQPPKERRPEQLEEQTNCISSIINGLGKRPGTYHLKKLAASLFPGGDTSVFYSYDRGDTEERYLFGIGDSQVTALDLTDGSFVDTIYTADQAYLLTANPVDDLRFHTIADTTFIANKSITPATSTPTDTTSVWERMLYVKTANYGRTYGVLIDGVVISTYDTPSTVTLTTTSSSIQASKAITLRTTTVLSNLLPDVQSWATANGVAWDIFGDVVYLFKADADYDLQVTDSSNGNDFIAVTHTISSYDDLPEIAWNGYKVKVTGVDSAKENDYYVQFKTTEGVSIGDGVWEEAAGFGVDTAFDPTTMPHKLVRESDGYFYFREIDWEDRSAGDDDTNPIPSFVGNKISSIVSYQGRLVFDTEENKCGSVTFDFFNFWAASVIQSSDDDPIDTASSDNQVTNLHSTVVFNSSLVSFSDKAQFLHSGDTPFSSKTFSLASKARYNNNIKCLPVASATSVFFSNDFGLFTGIREMRFDAATGNIAAEAITEQCKKYIPGSAVQIDSSTDYNILVVRTDTSDTDLYVYQWYDRDNKRVQAAWHKWTFGVTIITHKIINEYLYLLTKRGTDYCLEYIDLADQNTAGVDFPVRLGLLEKVDLERTARGYEGTPTLQDYSTISLADVEIVGGLYTGLAGTPITWAGSSSVYLSWDAIGYDESWDSVGYFTSWYDLGFDADAVEDLDAANTIIVPFDAIPAPGNNLYDDLGELLYDDSGALLFDDAITISVWVGLSYDSVAELTNPYVRDQYERPKTKGTLRYSSMAFNVADTGYVTVEVTKETGQVYTKVYDTKIIDDTLFLLNGPPTITDADVPVSIRSNRDRCVIKIKSSSHLPFYVSDIDWSGDYYESGRRTR